MNDKEYDQNRRESWQGNGGREMSTQLITEFELMEWKNQLLRAKTLGAQALENLARETDEAEKTKWTKFAANYQESVELWTAEIEKQMEARHEQEEER